jgi:hypothetical protein
MSPNARSSIALVLACSVLAVSLPSTAHADENEEATIVPVAPVASVEALAPVARAFDAFGAPQPPRIFLTRSEMLAPASLPGRLKLPGAVPMTDVKLSEKAITWIIIGAIVVGVLIIVGVVVVAGPGKKLPK